MLQKSLIEGSLRYQVAKQILGSSWSIPLATDINRWLLSNADSLPNYEHPSYIGKAIALYQSQAMAS
ncbi:hypothetical protein H6G36_25360 [Anabaena minutissima FACHB-250]|nr:hypothetical protein [Anabaena minutissima FACHB-250]